MSRATQQMRDVAERLIAFEAQRNKSAGTNTEGAFHVCGKLRPHLAPLMGSTGFQALLSRALVLAKAEAPRLSAVLVKADGSLACLDEPEAQLNPEELAGDGAVLVAQLLGLLEAFIGESLTLRMLRDVWPKLSLNDIHFKT